MGGLSGVNGIIIIMFGVLLLFGAVVWLFVSSKIKKEEKDNVKTKPARTSSKAQNPYKKNPNAVINKEDIFNFMSFDKIEDNMIIQDKGKKYNAIIKCKGINYNLMSEVEQLAVEEGFITFLNTLKSPIQLYVQAQNINLKDSMVKYREHMRGLEEQYEDLSTKYSMLVNSLEATDEEIDAVEKEKNSVQNVLEYGDDIIRYVDRLTLNKAMLQRSFYIVVSYYSSEITVGTEFKKEEIADMCFTELFTRVENIMSGLLSCSVSSEILDSNELAELLYSAYNRDDENYINVRQALESGFHRMYSTSKDAIQKKNEMLVETMKQEAEYKAVAALAKAVEDGTYVSHEMAESAYDQEVSKQAIDLIKSERVDENVKSKAKKIIVDDYKKEEQLRRNRIRKEKKDILENAEQSDKGKKYEENVIADVDDNKTEKNIIDGKITEENSDDNSKVQKSDTVDNSDETIV